MKFIDLSVIVNEQTPVYPGDPVTKIVPAGVLERNGYEDHYVSIGTHVGTHVDAPRHMLAGEKRIHELALDRFTGRGVYGKTGKNLTLDAVRGIEIREGDIVLLHTGMSEKYYEKEYYDNYPAISEELAKFFISKKVKMVGVDMCSVDHEPFPIHKLLLGNGVLIIENLTNLVALQGKEFTVYAFPLRVELDGFPTRVVAKIK